MGEALKRKRAQQFKTIGDRALAKLAEPGLWSSRPDVPATDCVFNGSGAGSVNVNDSLTLEAFNGKVRAVRGNREVGTKADAILIRPRPGLPCGEWPRTAARLRASGQRA